MTVRRLLNELDSRELTEWQAYEQVAGPLGGARDDVLAAIVASAATNAQRRKKDLVAPKDFMPAWGSAVSQQGWEEQKQIAEGLSRMLGGTFKGAA